MADSIMSSLVTRLIEPFRDHVLNHICYTINVGANVRALEGEVKKLKEKREDVQETINRDETAGKKVTHEVEGWLQNAANLEKEASSISSKYRGRNCMLLGTGWSFNCFSNHSIGVSAVKAKKDVEAERQWIQNKEITKVPPPPPVQEVPTATLGESSGTEIRSKCEQALDFLRNSPDGTLGIWGMGGVGKTTLLEHINNALAEDPSSFGFDRVILVTASRGCTTEKIRKLIAEKLNLPEQGDHYTKIFNYLKKKSFVLLLDDLWERLDLLNVGVPKLGVVGEVKHKLIMASRSRQVCHSMDAQHNTIKVDCLSPEKARQLFKENVGEETIRSHPLISGLADTVADECDGLPKALIAIARAMSPMKQVNSWMKAIKDLRKSKISEITGTEDPLPLLKFSYDYLDDPIIQECLLLCALWPEDEEIPAVEVIICWMGHNCLGEFDNLEDAYDNGYKIIDRLQQASLLEYSKGIKDISGEGTVSLHDLIRDMALWIARDCGANDKKWVVLADLGLKEAPQDERSWKEAHKMSLFHNNISTWPSHTLSAPNLTTLMLQRNLRYSEKFKFHDLDFLRNLHVLKYLDMSSNRDMGEFPIAICQLDKLEYLNLSDCDIDSLPEEVKNLKSLKYLLLRNHKIKQVSSQVLSNLVSLEVLDLFSGYRLNDNIDNLVECLKGRRLKSVRINVSPQSESDLNKLARFSVRPINIRDLCIDMRRGENLTSSIHLVPRLNIPCDGTLSNLNELYIRGDSSLVIEELVIGESHGSLPNRLHLQRLEVKEIVWKGVEQRDVFRWKLRDIQLHLCNQLKHVSWIVNLPHLERLVLMECRSIKHVVREEATETEGEGNNNKTATLPTLKILELWYLPELESFCNRASITLPSLQYLYVQNCPWLKKLPFDSPASCSKLRKINAEEKWWKSTVELDDDTRTHLQPFCDFY